MIHFIRLQFMVIGAVFDIILGLPSKTLWIFHDFMSMSMSMSM